MNGANDSLINPEVRDGQEVTKIPGKSIIQTDTPAGAAWVEKYLHPPKATRDDYCGYPDTNNSPSTDAEYKGLVDIPTTSGSGITAINYNKVLLLHTSSVIAPVITFKVEASTGVISQLPTDVVFNRNINVKDMVNQNSSGRMTYKSTTSWLNATGFNNQGNVTSAAFRPNIAMFRAGDLFKWFDLQAPIKSMSLYRGLANFFSLSVDDKKITKVINKLESFRNNAPNNEGYEVIYESRADDIDDIKSFITSCKKKFETSTAIDNFVQILQLGQIPTDPSQILMMSPNAVADKAVEGSFVVQKFKQPVIEYKDFAANGITPGVSSPVGMPVYILQLASPTTGTIEPINVIAQPGNSTAILADLPWFDFMCTWTLYEGLSVTTGDTPSIVTPPYISIKTIVGFEFQPLPDSMLSPFIRNSALYDFNALRMASTINHASADSLPAKMNFWGSLGKILLKAAPTVIDTISNIFGKERSADSKKLTNDTVASLTKKIQSMESKLSTKQPRKQFIVKQQPPRQRTRKQPSKGVLIDEFLPNKNAPKQQRQSRSRNKRKARNASV